MLQITRDLLLLAAPAFKLVKALVRMIRDSKDPEAAARQALEVLAHQAATDAALRKMGKL